MRCLYNGNLFQFTFCYIIDVCGMFVVLRHLVTYYLFHCHCIFEYARSLVRSVVLFARQRHLQFKV